jgi:hypothetical protein
MKIITLPVALTAAAAALGEVMGFAPTALTLLAGAFAAGLALLVLADYRLALGRRPSAPAPARRVRRIRPGCPVYRSPYGSIIIFDTTIM